MGFMKGRAPGGTEWELCQDVRIDDKNAILRFIDYVASEDRQSKVDTNGPLMSR
jgi:hypothetical protein